MAVLSDTARAEVWAEFMQEVSSGRLDIGSAMKADLRAMFNGLDDYFNTNASAINTSIPQPARTAVPTATKAKAGVMLLEKRYLKGV